MDIDHICGELGTVNHNAVGFVEAVAQIALRGAVDLPNLEALQPDGEIEIWRASS